MKKAFVVIGLFLCSSAVSLADNSDPRAFVLQRDFEKVGTPTNYAVALQAVKETVDFDEHCSGTTVSSQGHYLQALHCVRNCIEAPDGVVGDLVSYTALDGTTKDDANGRHDALATIDRDKLAKKNLVCVLADSGHAVRYKLIYVPAAGWLTDYGMGLSMAASDLKRLRDTGYGFNVDFVILKNLDVTGKTACLPVAQTKLKPGDPLWSVSYPFYDRQTDKDETYDRRFTRGAVTADRTEVEALAPEPGIISSSVDAEEGSSGSPIIDQSGELAGVNVYVDKGDSTDYLPGTTRSVSAVRIRKMVTDALGKAAADEIFDCQQ